MSRRRLHLALPLLAVALLAAAGFVYWQTREPALHDVAQRVLAMPPADPDLLPYAWQGRDHVLVWSYVSGADGNRVRLDRYALPGGRAETVLPDTRLVVLPEARQRVSPDGAWLAQWSFGPPGIWCNIVDLRTRAIHTTLWPSGTDGASQPVWTPDGKSWVVLQERRDGLHALLTPPGRSPPGRDVHVAVAKLPGIVGPAYPADPLGVTRSGTAVAANISANHDRQVTDVFLALFPLASASVRARTIRIAVPHGCRVDEMALSPAGDRIAWLVFSRRAPPLAQWLARFVPFIRSEPRTVEEIWVTALDGGELRRLGGEAVPAGNTDAERRLYPQDIAWTPDGEKISFVLRGELCALPAP